MNQSAEYKGSRLLKGIRMMIWFLNQHGGGQVAFSGFPDEFKTVPMRKILNDLVKKECMGSQRGQSGGYWLWPEKKAEVYEVFRREHKKLYAILGNDWFLWVDKELKKLHKALKLG